MPRRKRLRKVVMPPGFAGFEPYGSRGSHKEPVELLFEEYEAIKHADYDLLNHQEAADLMKVSRATFARIYESARRKIAKALVEIRTIESTCGNAYFDESWFSCNRCHTRFTIPEKAGPDKCPMCKSQKFQPLKTPLSIK